MLQFDRLRHSPLGANDPFFFSHLIPSFKLSPLIFSFYDPPFISSFFTSQISTSASQELPGVISIARVSTLQALSVVFVGQVTQEMVLFVTVGYNDI